MQRMTAVMKVNVNPSQRATLPKIFNFNQISILGIYTVKMQEPWCSQTLSSAWKSKQQTLEPLVAVCLVCGSRKTRLLWIQPIVQASVFPCNEAFGFKEQFCCTLLTTSLPKVILFVKFKTQASKVWSTYPNLPVKGGWYAASNLLSCLVRISQMGHAMDIPLKFTFSQENGGLWAGWAMFVVSVESVSSALFSYCMRSEPSALRTRHRKSKKLVTASYTPHALSLTASLFCWSLLIIKLCLPVLRRLFVLSGTQLHTHAHSFQIL